MKRDWDATWEHWRDLSPEERESVRIEIMAGFKAANQALVEAMSTTAEAINGFAAAIAPFVDEVRAVEDAKIAARIVANDQRSRGA